MMRAWLVLVLTVLPAPAWAGSGFLYFMRPQETLMPVRAALGFGSVDTMIRWTGCTTLTGGLTIMEYNRPNAGYGHDMNGHPRIFMTRALWEADLPDGYETLAYIFLHEAGHCLQDQRKELDHVSSYLDIRRLEFDAEAFAHRCLTVLGWDADGIMLRQRLWFAAYDGRDPEEETITHGSAISISRWARAHDGLVRRVILAP